MIANREDGMSCNGSIMTKEGLMFDVPGASDSALALKVVCKRQYTILGRMVHS